MELKIYYDFEKGHDVALVTLSRTDLGVLTKDGKIHILLKEIETELQIVLDKT